MKITRAVEIEAEEFKITKVKWEEYWYDYVCGDWNNPESQGYLAGKYKLKEPYWSVTVENDAGESVDFRRTKQEMDNLVLATNVDNPPRLIGHRVLMRDNRGSFSFLELVK